jgi:putative hydrolase of the HAD superfamily
MESIVISESVGVSKPDVCIFQRGLTELELAPAEVLYVGDHPVNDVLGASAAGLTPVWLKGTYSWPTDHKEPKFQLERIDDLVELLEQRFGRTTHKTKQE